MVCSADRSWAVVPVLVLLFVALWFILRGDLLCVFPCVILFLCFSVLLVLQLPRLGRRELILVLFIRLFGLCLFRFVGFLFLLGSGNGCGLWLWHSLDFSLTFFFPIIKLTVLVAIKHNRYYVWSLYEWFFCANFIDLKTPANQLLTKKPLCSVCVLFAGGYIWIKSTTVIILSNKSNFVIIM